MRDDKIWNFVLACPKCNEKKNNRIPTKKYLVKIEKRNEQMKIWNKNDIVFNDFIMYSGDLLNRMWKYAKTSGLKEFNM